MKAQKIYRSIPIQELFMPLESREDMMVDVAERLADTGYYHGFEVGPLMETASHRRLRRLQEQGTSLMIWGAPLYWREMLNLSSLDSSLREKSIKRSLDILNSTVEIGATYLGVPSGDDPGEALREDAKKALHDSMARIADVAKNYNVGIIIEPLDRYVHKKQLIGPMKESMEWFAPLHTECPNTFINWDSAHEMLGEIDLAESMELASPYMAQIHLCNCITDKNNPMFGDWHMDVGQAPDFSTEGYLTPEVGARILQQAASYTPPNGVPFTHVSVEMRSHIGDDLWEKEKTARNFLTHCYELAGLE